jgi:5-methylcytosine-specific restriction protein A
MPTRAPTHRPDAGSPRAKPSSTERGYGSRWQRLRWHVLRTQPLCRPCFADGRVTAATEVDHIRPKVDGGGDEIDNLQPICRRCHADKSAREGRRG